MAETMTPIEKVKLHRLPLLLASKEGRPMDFLVDFVMVGHRNMGDQKASTRGQKIPTGSPEGGVSTSKSRNLTSE